MEKVHLQCRQIRPLALDLNPEINRISTQCLRFFKN